MSLLSSLLSPIYKPKNNLTATTNPTVNDDITLGYQTGSQWFNQSTSEMFVCISNADGAAVWEQTSLTIDDLGSMALQDADSVVITGGAIDGTPIGSTTPSTGEFSEMIVGNPGTENSGINIGGVTYESSFKVSDIDGTNYAQTILHRHSTTLEPLIVGARSNSNNNSHADVTAGQNVFGIYGAGWAGSNYKLFGSITLGADSIGTISNTSAPGRFAINITPNGSTASVEVLSIDNKGTLAPKTFRLPFATLTDAATVAIDLSLANNFNLTLGGSRTLGIPTNPSIGQEGTITVRQDSTGSRTLAYSWCYIFPQLLAPILSTGKGAMDLLAYKVLSYSTGTATMTIATPCVVTWTSHGLVYGQRVAFTTTGALPTGITANTGYYVNVINANTFNLATSLANLQAGTYLATSGSQSGTHTVTQLTIIVAMNANNGA